MDHAVISKSIEQIKDYAKLALVKEVAEEVWGK